MVQTSKKKQPTFMPETGLAIAPWSTVSIHFFSSLNSKVNSNYNIFFQLFWTMNYSKIQWKPHSFCFFLLWIFQFSTTWLVFDIIKKKNESKFLSEWNFYLFWIKNNLIVLSFGLFFNSLFAAMKSIYLYFIFKCWNLKLFLFYFFF